MNHTNTTADRHDTLGPPRWGFVRGRATVTQANGLVVLHISKEDPGQLAWPVFKFGG